MTFFDFVIKHESKESVNLLKNFTYYDNLKKGNAEYVALSYLKNYNQKNYITLKNGMSQLVNKLEQKIKTQKNCEIKMSFNVEDVLKEKNIFKIKNTEYTCEKIIFCIPGKFLKNFTLFKSITPVFDSVYLKNSNRTYILVNDKDVNFFKNNMFVTKEKIKTATCFKDEKCLISYCDGDCADYWFNQNKKGSLEMKIFEDMKKISKSVHKPKLFKNYYWLKSLPIWKPKFNYKKISKQMINPYKNVFVAGDTFSLDQKWIEGALSTSEQVIKLCKKQNNKTRKIKNIKGGTNKIYSMSDVKKHNKKSDGWIVIKNKVYDVTKFIDQHPGGPQILLDRIGKDATNDFIARGHPEYVEKTILPKYYIGKLSSKTKKN